MLWEMNYIIVIIIIFVWKVMENELIIRVASTAQRPRWEFICLRIQTESLYYTAHRHVSIELS